MWLLVVACTVLSVFGADPDVSRDFVHIVTSKGYACEPHQVLTPDGYLLTLFRVPSKNTAPKSSTPVLLFHGLMDSGFTWILNMPSQSLPYILSDNGYDVWIGNARGNRYSDQNIYFSPSDPRFWNFTFDEFAKYDLPSSIDFILNFTGFSQLYYVGHSQGTAQMFAGLSMESEWGSSLSSKIKLFVGLGPATAPKHQTNPYVSFLVLFMMDEEQLLNYFGINEFFPPLTGILAEAADLLCLDAPSICEGVVELLCGQHKAAFNDSRMEVMVAHEPGGTSVKNMAHWGQAISIGNFQMFDYGVPGNLIFYNQTFPPKYDLKKISKSVPIALFYGTLDVLADPQDVLEIISDLPTPPVFTKEIPTYSHLDFCWAIDANVNVYNDILNLFAKYK